MNVLVLMLPHIAVGIISCIVHIDDLVFSVFWRFLFLYQCFFWEFPFENLNSVHSAVKDWLA